MKTLDIITALNSYIQTFTPDEKEAFDCCVKNALPVSKGTGASVLAALYNQLQEDYRTEESKKNKGTNQSKENSSGFHAGDYGAETAGKLGVAIAGDYGAANAGDYGAAITEDYGAANAGYYGAAITGDYGAANAGEGGTASAGYCGISVVRENGKSSVEIGGAAVAFDGWAKGENGAALVLIETDEEKEIKGIKAVLVDGEKIKPNTYYRLKNGEVIER